MGFARTYSVALVGITGHLVEVEADISAALPGFVLLGLPDTALSESKDRVRSGAKNTGLPLPQRKLTVNALAYSAGMSSSTIYSMLNTKSKNPGVITIQKICDAMEISMREFFDSPLFEDLEPIVQ